MLHDFGDIADLYQANPVQAQTAWLALKPVEDGIISGNEMVGSPWMILLSIAAIQNKRLPKALNICAIAVAVSGLLTLIPIVMEATNDMIFGLGSIIWCVWLGVALLKHKAV